MAVAQPYAGTVLRTGVWLTLQNILLLLLGVAAGTLAGLFGIGGGIIIIPALVYLFGFSQHQAQATSIALLVPPIGILGAIAYYKAGFVDLRVAALVAAGFFAASLIGARLAITLPDPILKKVFGLFLLLVSLRMIIG